jgi:hypothetical protein
MRDALISADSVTHKTHTGTCCLRPHGGRYEAFCGFGSRAPLGQAGSVTVKIDTGRIGRYHTFTVYWRAAGRSHRKTFSHEKEAQKFAGEQAENLAAGQVQSPSITATEVSTFREAERRLGDTAPIHVAAGEYASAVRRLGDAATLNQAVEFFFNKLAPVRASAQRVGAFSRSSSP